LTETVRGIASPRQPLPEREHLVLRDGRFVGVRPIRPSDADELQEGFALLSERSRYQRFHTGTPALSDRVARYFAEIDHNEHEALVALPLGVSAIVGVARFIRSKDDPTEAELSITVADDWQRIGLGSCLLRLLSDRARCVGIDRFTMEMLADNEGILALVRAAGGEVERGEGAVTSGHLDLVRRPWHHAPSR
jgi:RimJ/RimL family protein N-acetyltransferase